MTTPFDERLSEIFASFAKRIENTPRGKTYGWEDAKQAIQQLIDEAVREAMLRQRAYDERTLVRVARIDELNQIMPPEQYKDYARIPGSDYCAICGFDSERFRKHLQQRIATLTNRRNSESSQHGSSIY